MWGVAYVRSGADAPIGGGVRRRAEVRVHTIISYDHLIFLALYVPSDGTRWTRTPGVHGMASKGSVKL